MARKVQVLLVCDMHGCGTEARGTISFAFGGAAFEIDLCASHEHDLYCALKTYISHGRRVASARRSARGSQQHGPQQRESADIRRWARKRGIVVSDKGRIPAKVIELWKATH